ncbi:MULTISPECIES: transposase [Streptomyces]|uniref:transposase n=1 Tax=Streptomyces sp. NBC_00847 TaxID=2975850 RepID=UPI002255EF5F|nr:transposase [Streptomyces sp. NBC_00847]MCX4884828.1 transposase [Streptomyces sp. NBC_00847]
MVIGRLRRHRGRRCRYRGLAKTHIQHVLTALAINVERLSLQEPVSHSYRPACASLRPADRRDSWPGLRSGGGVGSKAAKGARGARGLLGAAAAMAGVEPDHHRCRLHHRKVPPVAADLPVGTGDLASVEADFEGLPAEAILGPGAAARCWREVGPTRVTRWRRAAASMPATAV